MAGKLSHLQTLRGVAATLVVADHALGILVRAGALSPRFDEPRWQLGGLGVATFFVISGFIMIHTAYDEFGGPRRALRFALKRLVRIAPIYWVATLLSVRHARSIWDFLGSLLFIPTVREPGASMHPLLPQGWTLSYEVFFYGLFAFALLVPRRIGLPALLLSLVGLVAFGASIKPLSDLSAPATLLTFFTAPTILLFAVGIVLGVLARSEMIPAFVKAPIVLTVIGYGIAMATVVVFNVPNAKPFPAQILFWIPAILAVFFCIYAPSKPNGYFDVVTARFGDASYCTYLFHLVALNPLAVVFSYVPHTIPFAIIFLIVSLALANGVGLVIHLFVERKITAYLTVRLGLKSSPTTNPTGREALSTSGANP
ncbi:MAG: acyltransferase [Caulobacteraceae bacterium]|nr:acyltransferase [Caulobacteraceae bacterium]